MRRVPLVARLGGSVAAVGVVTAVLVHLVQVNPTTVALTYVVIILFVATGWGIAEGMTAVVTAVLCFNFFFLPPVGTLTIANPQNWVALVAFFVTALVASQLSGRARQRDIEALGRQRDLERLYALSRALLLAEDGPSIQQAIARRIAETFQIPAVALYDERTGRTAFGGQADFRHIEDRLHEAARQANSSQDASGNIVTAIRLGGSPIGSLALAGGGLTDTVLQSVANLAAIGLERARAQESTTRAEAARQSGELRAAVLDALAHEFKTPLTSMKVAAGELHSSVSISHARDRELVAIVGEELEHLQGLVTDAIQMIRIDAGDFVVHPDRQPVAQVIEASLKKLEGRLQGRQVKTNVPAGLEVQADSGLLALALQQLLDNAVKYSSPTSTIEVTATGNSHVEVAVRNTGSAIAQHEQPRVFERFYRGAHSSQIPGTGMGLAIVAQIARAHGGDVSVSSSPGGPTEFKLSLPSEKRAP